MELRDRNFILVDTETTGFDEKKHQILEVGILVIKDLKVVGEFEVKIKHNEYTITSKAMQANKINILEHEKEAVFENEATEKILKFLNKHKSESDEGYIVIGQNVQFDIKFLKHELNSLYEVGMIDETWEPKNSFCTMTYYKNICNIPAPRGNGIKNPKLSEVIDFLNISQDKIATKANELFQGSGNYHDARFDTAAAYLLVIEGIKQKYIKPGFFSEQLKK